jgi:hypothetical protein
MQTVVTEPTGGEPRPGRLIIIPDSRSAFKPLTGGYRADVRSSNGHNVKTSQRTRSLIEHIG